MVAVHKFIVLGILLIESDLSIPETLLAIYRHYPLLFRLFEFVLFADDHLVVSTGCAR